MRPILCAKRHYESAAHELQKKSPVDRTAARKKRPAGLRKRPRGPLRVTKFGQTELQTLRRERRAPEFSAHPAGAGSLFPHPFPAHSLGCLPPTPPPPARPPATARIFP